MTVTIRRAQPGDAAAYARIMSDPAVYPGLMQLPYSDEASWRARLCESSAPGRSDLVLVAETDAGVVATAGLHPVGPALRRRHAMMLGISVARESQGLGVGSVLMTAMCDYADGWAGVLRLELTVFADNAAAIALYRKFGFETEGLMRGFAMRHGAYADALAMARLHPSPPTIGGARPV